MRPSLPGVCLVFSLLGAACIPDDAPAWLVDRPKNWGVIATVVQPGGYSSGLIVAEGQARAAALPLDTLELQRLTLAPAGTVLQPPIWVALANSLAWRPGLGLQPEACPELLPLTLAAPCRLGEGERVRFALGGAYTAEEEFRGEIAVLAVGSASDEVTSEECVERYFASPKAGLESCLIMRRDLELGPLGKLLELLPGGGSELGQVDIPPEANDEPADTHPVLESFLVTRGASGDPPVAVGDGDTVMVRAGERITVSWRFTEASEQEYFALRRAQPDRYTLEPRVEVLIEDVALSAFVEGFERRIDERRWIAPAEPVILYLYTADSREGRLAATLRFVTEDADSP